MMQMEMMDVKDMIAPSAKKLWGVEEGKEDSHKTGGGGILNLNDQMWRDSTWSTSDHGVTQGMAMVPSARRPGATFPGTDNGAGVLSPRSSDSSGLGVKMVEYVLGTSPTSKDNGLEPRMRGLVLNSDGSDVKKEKDKAPASPYDVKKELVDASGAIQTNGMVPVVQNGIDNEDKYKYSSGPGGVVCYSRTPGSRQPSPTDDGSELAAVQAAVHHSHQKPARFSDSSDHGVTQGMAMVPSARRPGATFPGTDNGAGVLSPRSSDSSGLGVKMVEYVLGTSPTSKDNGLEPRMRGLVLVSI
ncbi:pumilio homolog 1-like [Diaphorina citri]|uniref:Pumilio homolog 1-like n=1 Tax=Diaphorina citri TaxID=121845 RepID=A0A1S3D3E6_DIACI|nr:pumilio homolog 1-like [Diaphorina citri]